MDQKKCHDFDYVLDEDELALLKTSESGELNPVKDMEKEIAQLKKAAESVAGSNSDKFRYHQCLNGTLQRV